MKSNPGKANVRAFKAALERVGNGTFVSVPFDVEAAYGTRGHVKVKASFDGHPYRGILANMGTGSHIIIVRKDIRKAIGKEAGDIISVELSADTDERKVELPPSLKEAMSQNAAAEKFFHSLSYTNQKEYCAWITSAKKEETRHRRLTDTIGKLLSGKKNPFEK